MSHHVVERVLRKLKTKDLQQSANARWHTREKDFQPSRLCQAGRNNEAPRPGRPRRF